MSSTPLPLSGTPLGTLQTPASSARTRWRTPDCSTWTIRSSSWWKIRKQAPSSSSAGWSGPKVKRWETNYKWLQCKFKLNYLDSVCACVRVYESESECVCVCGNNLRLNQQRIVTSRGHSRRPVDHHPCVRGMLCPEHTHFVRHKAVCTQPMQSNSAESVH